jgi:carbon-monoxide dehydrogenase medium subunit
MTTHAELADSGEVGSAAPALQQAARVIGDRQVRARGTIGGSLSHNDPAADLPAVMLALNATLVLRSTGSERLVAANEFFTGLLETALRPNEVLTEVRLPAAPRSAYAKYPNPASHYAIVGVAAALNGDGAETSARIGVTGAAAVAFRASQAEAALQGKELTADVVAQAAERSPAGQQFLGDIHASSEYRAALVSVMTRRALEAIGS